MDRFASLGVIKNLPVFDPAKLEMFAARIEEMQARGLWTRQELVCLFAAMLPELAHKETGKLLDERMSWRRGKVAFSTRPTSPCTST